MKEMPEKIILHEVVPASPTAVYNAWMDGGEHSKFTGQIAKIEREIGGDFTAGDDYITGKTLELETDRRIVQSWRSTDVPDGAGDSLLEIMLEKTGRGTELTLIHSEIPDGQGSYYEQGWKDYYFKPMIEYFNKR